MFTRGFLVHFSVRNANFCFRIETNIHSLSGEQIGPHEFKPTHLDISAWVRVYKGGRIADRVTLVRL
jgi:hypothetical protein